jgi:hypothetical protein
VLSLFDSHTLEAQQLTQYVGILRMMDCERGLIIDKFLAAHKYRSQRMIKTFLQDIDNITKRSGHTSHSNSDNDKSDNILTVAHVRTFHQSLIVGLIEASKGAREIFSDTTSKFSNEHNESTNSKDSFSLTSAYDDLQAMIGLVIPDYLKCISKSLKMFFVRYDEGYAEAEKQVLVLLLVTVHMYDCLFISRIN